MSEPDDSRPQTSDATDRCDAPRAATRQLATPRVVRRSSRSSSIVGVGAAARTPWSRTRSDGVGASTADERDLAAAHRRTTTARRPRRRRRRRPPRRSRRSRSPRTSMLPRSRATGSAGAAAGPVVVVYEARMKELHFDPGTVDGVVRPGHAVRGHRGRRSTSACRATASSARASKLALEHFTYTPAKPKAEADRVEIDLDKQVLTRLQELAADPASPRRRPGAASTSAAASTAASTRSRRPGTTTSTTCTTVGRRASSARCGTRTTSTAASRCTGSQSVPTYPASHGCARIPMHIADYFPTLVHQGRVGVRGRHAEAAGQRLRRPGAHHDHPTTDDHDRRRPRTTKPRTRPPR